MQLSAEPIDLLETHNQWRPLIRIDPIGVTLHEQIGMDVNALDPHFDQTEEAAQFFTVFADAVSCRNDSFELDWAFERARSPAGTSELPLKHLLHGVSTNERLPDHLMIDGILYIELCH